MRNLEKILTGTALAVVLTLSAPQVSVAGFDEAVKAYEAGDYKLAFDEWLPLAESNDPAAMRNLGHLYRRGLGVDMDFEKAMSWYMQAANMGFDRAQANVGSMYLKGQGAKQDYVKASEWFTKAARNGHTISQYNLGLLYEHGKGVEKSTSKALGWYNLAAKAGHPQALNKLSILIAGDPTVVEEEAKTNKTVGTTKPPAVLVLEQKKEVVVKKPVVKAQPVVIAEEKKTIEKAIEPIVTADAEKVPAKKKWDPFAGSANNLSSAESEMPKGEPTVFNQKQTQKEPLKPEMVVEPAKSVPVIVEVTETKIVVEEPKVAALEKDAEVPKVEEKGFFSALKSLLAVSPEKEVKKTEAPEDALVQKKVVPSEAVVAKAPSTRVVPVVPAPAATISITGSGLTLDEQMEMAELSFTLEEYQQALGIWAPLAQRGNAEAQYNLGVMFDSGFAVPVDRVRAFYWWDKAKRNGSKKAAASLHQLEKSLTYLEKRQLKGSN